MRKLWTMWTMFSLAFFAYAAVESVMASRYGYACVGLAWFMLSMWVLRGEYTSQAREHPEGAAWPKFHGAPAGVGQSLRTMCGHESSDWRVRELNAAACN